MTKRRLLLEALEDRRVFAGNVTVALAGLNLYILGDNADNAIDITASTGPNSAGRVTITPQAGTTLNGLNTSLTTRSFGNLNIRMLRGDDTVNFIGAASAVDALIGSMYIDQGEGDNTLSVSDYRIGQTLAIRNGSGTDSVTLDNVVTGLDIVVNNGSSSAGTQATSILNGTTVGRNLIVTNLNGSNTIDLSGTAEVNVGGSLVINNQGVGAADTATITLENVSVAGNLSLINRPVANVTLGDVAGGAVNVTNNTFIQNINPLANNSVLLQNTATTLGSSSSNRLAIQNGAGNNTVIFDGVTINGSTNVNNGNGDATVTASSAGTFNGALNIVNGSGGSNTVNIQDGSISGDVRIANGNGTDNTVTLGDVATLALDKALTIRNGNVSGANTVTMNNATVVNAVLVINGNGTNNVALGELPAGAGTFTASNLVNIINNNGDSTININNATVAGALSLRSGTAGAGGHTIEFGNLSDNSVGGNLSVSTVGGDTNLTLNQVSVTGNLEIRTSSGDDIILLAAGGATGLSVSGKTFIDTGAGDDTVTIGNSTGTATFLDFLTVRMGTGSDSITVGANTANTPSTAIATGDYLFDGGIDPAGSNSITVSATVLDPFADLATTLKYRNFSAIILVP
jgi:hypothetical protein